jgi:drug/metabolite transporter (DMT)-like permease
MLREELARLWRYEERHRRLFARLTLAAVLSLAVYVLGTVLVWAFESGHGDIHGLGDAAFFVAVQLLTVSSSLSNPVTVGGRVVDIVLEAWGVFVITAVAGSFAAFFRSGDSAG